MTLLLDAPAFLSTSSVVALGDSITSGEGVGIVTPAAGTWAALLAERLDAGEFHNLARAGARLSHVRAEQLSRAVALRPTVATLCVGLNDIVKTGCAPQGIAADLTALIRGLRATGAMVVVTRLHDPSRIFRLPKGLAAQVLSRVELLNATITALAGDDPGVVVVDLGSMQEERGLWSVDRVHPSVSGQRRLADLAAQALGLPVDTVSASAIAPSQAAQLLWLIRCGLPWLAKRFPEVGPPVAKMAVAAARRSTPGLRPA